MHPSDEDLELYYLLRLSPALIASIKSHILECEICKEKVQRLSESVEEIQRAVGRFHDVRVFRVLEGAVLPGQVLHISETEMKLELPEPLLLGTFVQVRVGTKMIMGKATHCVPLLEKFQVSVEIDSIFLIPRRGTTGEDE